MKNYEHYMSAGSKLEEQNLYRRAAEQYNKATFASPPPQSGAASRQETASRKAANRCLIKSKIKITEGL